MADGQRIRGAWCYTCWRIALSAFVVFVGVTAIQMAMLSTTLPVFCSVST